MIIMNDFLQNAYVFLWAVLALLMFFAGRKQGPIAYVLSIFFVFMTVWYALRAFGGLPMFEGTLSIVFRCVLGVFLALLVLVYLISKRRKYKNDDTNNKK